MTTVDQKDPGQRPYLDYSSNPPPPSYNDVMYYYSQPPPPPPPPNASVSLPGHDSADVLHGRNELFFMESMGDAPRAGLMMQMGESSDIAAVRAQGLSLSLGSELPMPSFLYRPCSEGFFPASHHSSAESNHLREKSFADPSPHGLSSLAGSRYLMAAQELLDEAVNVRSALKNRSQKRDSDWRSPCEELPSHPAFDLPAAERQELQSKMAKLMAMLDQVDRKYKHYHQQMQSVVSSFDSVVGAGAAKPYTGLALQTISRQFRALRDAINGQLSTTRRTLGEKDPPTVRSGGVPRLRCVDQQIRDQRAFQQQAWRPQRGLPETSVSILRAWLFEHFLHPYPKDSDKLMLASQTGLTRSQVSNWFINARVRLWKPMIEEMYEEERKEAETELADENSAAGSSSAGKPQSFADDCDLLPEEATAQADVNSRYMPVRLTLGLRHGEGGLLAPSRVNQTSPIDGNAAEYVVDRRDRFGAVPLLHDFVAM